MSSRYDEALAAKQERPGWETLLVEERVHYYPLRDIAPHRPTGYCACKPQRTMGGQCQVESGLWLPVKATYLHHAFDGRDLVEACEAGSLTVADTQGGERG